MRVHDVELGEAVAQEAELAKCGPTVSFDGRRPGRSATGVTGTSSARRESPLAKSVTSWPRRTSSSVSQDSTRSVPPYRWGGTAS